jgi:hypothetical protein
MQTHSLALDQAPYAMQKVEIHLPSEDAEGQISE